MTSPHIVHVTFKPKLEYFEAFTDIMKSVKVDLPTVEGCQNVRVLSHKETPYVFTLIEDWQSEEHHTAHITHLTESGQWTDIENMLEEAPETFVLNQV